MELAVGIMLVILGVLTLTGVGRTASIVAGSGAPGGHTLLAHDHVHTHGDYIHWHPHGHGAEPHGHAEHQTPLARVDRSRLGRLGLYQWMRPFVVGVVHGLAGSAAIALMVLSIIHDARAAIGYLLLFGIGTVGGMMLITLALSAPFAFTRGQSAEIQSGGCAWRSGLIEFRFRDSSDLRHGVCRWRAFHGHAELEAALSERETELRTSAAAVPVASAEPLTGIRPEEYTAISVH